MQALHADLTEKVIGIFYHVYNELGHGFLEKVYQNAMYIELKTRGFNVEAQKRMQVFYKGHEVGDYRADLVVNDCLILELKAAEGIVEEFEYQLLNYLRSSNMEVGLLLNFGKKPQVKRKIYENDRKV